MALLDCIDAGTLKIIPGDDRAAVLSDSSVSDTWETADFSSYVRKGTKAVYGMCAIVSNTADDIALILTRGYGETGGTGGQYYTLRIEAQIGASGDIVAECPVIIYAPDGKFEYRRLSSAIPIRLFRFYLWGYFI